MLSLFIRFSLVLLILLPANGYAQQNNCESSWMIDHYFKDNARLNRSLKAIYRNTIEGNYSGAKSIIQQERRIANGQQLAALMTYEANIAYNESNYKLSIALCDSALQILKGDLTHRYSLRALNYKAKGLGALNEYTRAGEVIDTVILIANETGDDYNLGAAYYYYGSVYSDLGDYRTCARYIKKSIAIRKRIDDQLGLAASYSFMGLCYAGLDNYTLAIEYIQKSIPIREKAGDKRGLANSYLTMYKVYYELGEIDKALDSELKSLRICKEIGDLQCVSGRYTNLGQLFQKKGQYKEALNYHRKALELSKKLQIKNRTALVHENIARLYSLTGKHKEALLHIDSSLILRKEIGDAEGLTSAHLVMASILLETGELKSSVQFAEQALKSARKLEIRSMEKEAHQLLSQAWEKIGKTDLALAHFRSFIHLKDSLFSIDQSKELVRQELEFNFAKKQEQQRIEQQKKEEKARQESRRQRNIILWSAVALAVLSLLLGFSIYQYRLKNRSQKELEAANGALNLKNTELARTKEIIELQHTEITDSIRYARQIQQAILPTNSDLKEYFEDSFVIFHPKDVISGDFYWATRLEDTVILATVDCTGHGVPGGFMSMLGISLLNELVIEQGINSPALILHKLREKVISSLRQKGQEGEQKDGMDMTILVYNRTTQNLSYGAANHVFYHVSNGAVTEMKGNRQPVGIFGDELLPYDEYNVQLKKGDRIYTFTDGFPDQFGGPKGKKFKYQQLKENVLNIQQLSIGEQGKILENKFKDWKGELEQTDDVTVIGLQF